MGEAMALTIGECLKTIRKKRGLSQQKLAEEAGLSYVMIAKIEQGVTKEPSVMSMMKLADVLGVSLDELVGRTLDRSRR
jgi:transcriptional regulator with XRE-family HTH domain